MRRSLRPNLALAMAGLAAVGLAACGSTPDLPPAPMAEVPIRAPASPMPQLVVAIPEAAPVPYPMRAELTRGGPGVCAPAVDTVLDPVGQGRFRLVLEQPGFVVTRESVLRRPAGGPPDAPELALDGANNGRCDYLIWPALRG
jgi:hypothetical protein